MADTRPGSPIYLLCRYLDSIDILGDDAICYLESLIDMNEEYSWPKEGQGPIPREWWTMNGRRGEVALHFEHHQDFEQMITPLWLL